MNIKIKGCINHIYKGVKMMVENADEFSKRSVYIVVADRRTYTVRSIHESNMGRGEDAAEVRLLAAQKCSELLDNYGICDYRIYFGTSSGDIVDDMVRGYPELKGWNKAERLPIILPSAPELKQEE